MRNERNISNNLTYYLISSCNAASALSVIVEVIQQANNKDVYEKCISALNFLSDELYVRAMALDDFIEDGELDNITSNKDVYSLLAERKREIANKED